MTTPRLPLTALLIAVIAAAPAPAQTDTIRVGHGWTKPLAGAVDTTVMYVVRDGSRQKMMTYIETILPTPDGFLIVQQNIAPDGSVATLDTIALAARTLATLWHADVTPRGRMRVTFADGRMMGTATTAAGAATPVDTAAPATAFDFSVSSILARHLPLRPGYAAVLESFDVHRGPVFTAVRVTGEERLEVAGTKYTTWRLESAVMGRTVHSWVDQATQRNVRVSVSMGNVEMVAERP